MCGIAGRFHPGFLPADAEWHVRSAALLAHRGPDGSGHFVDDRCELVHRRLALLDLTPSGDQPLCNEDASVHVVFNGEIYNHLELRRWLAGRGHVFRGSSDTEVLVHAYEEVGDRFVEALRGIFAFAIYDARRGRLLLARDRFGVKPLFWAQREGELIFASEMKAITTRRGFRPALDRQACYDYLGLGYVPEPATGFANVNALPAGTTLAMESSRPCIARFHQVTVSPDRGRSLEAATEAAAATLQRAVRSQAAADVPVAALLSGGIDSSLVVAAYRRTAADVPTTFSVRFPDPRFDESEAAAHVAAHLGVRHETVELDDYALHTDALLDLLRHFDQPFADLSLIPMHWVARAVRERGFICTLSGDGGDEAFGGYERFRRAGRLTQLMALPDWSLRALHGAGERLAWRTRDWGRQVAKAAALAEAGHRDSAILIAGLSNYLSEPQKRALVRAEARDSLLAVYRHFDGNEPPAAVELEELSRRMTEKLFAVSLPSDMLRKVDMMSMRASIEVRVPMLDEELVALGLGLPHRLKSKGRAGKRVLRELAAQWLPGPVARRPKHGFSIPIDVMVPPGFHRAARELLLAPDARTRPFLDPALTERWLHGFERARGGDHGGEISRGGMYQRVFILLALELWMRENDLWW